MSDAIDLSQLTRGFKAGPLPEQPAPSWADRAQAVATVAEEQRREHRTVFCRPECADRIRSELAAAGLGPWVTVVASELVDEGQVLVARTPLGEDGRPEWLLPEVRL